VNYLAHAYLSFGRPEILAGNLISDFVKGKKKLDYPAGIQVGISLHRDIDYFTDTHEATHQAKSYFRTPYRLYSGAIADVVYDHFLAADPGIFPGNTLEAFAQHTYSQLAAFQSVFPDRFGRMFSYMRSQDWLSNYRNRQGIFNSFAGLARRASYMPAPEEACRIFIGHYDDLRACYQVFFPAVRAFAAGTLQELE
jgi:acyl carrier protein phosphodiesterase